MAGWLQGLEMAVGRPSAAALTAGDVALSEAEPDIFPCLLAMCGSAVGFIKIERDGSFNVVDGSSRGGKAFFGLGKILTKCKTYEELMDLASQGDLRGVNVFTDELFHSPDSVESDDSIYKKSGNALPGLIFSFGKAADSDTMDFKREDLARGWLHYILLDLVQCAQYCCSKHDIKRLFFSGSFCNHPLVRHIITTESVRRNLFQLALSSLGMVQIDFIKPGAHLGALGCAINDVVKSIGK
jgi:type II pantothenate kinase